ncbi:fructose-6-phosphate aldolase [Thermoanaerobacterium thermosaccharolyticum]|uniref:Fructose-6-phosphate aldolase n=1 Tax=Thermoanaerobacterium thermosaccharolyticum TaxID=1517 RepID=A0A223HZ27_THETR|nr:hypothetical protein [Thermoanaerobacterium thermosaccharolyticum]AST57730.1 fructose-6-phosphate aldolase [Thermoanaerobacterium thermosaccharolyticum]
MKLVTDTSNVIKAMIKHPLTYSGIEYSLKTAMKLLINNERF